jgi:hypothetical protein
MEIQILVLYAPMPRRSHKAVDRRCSSIREFGFRIPCLARSSTRRKSEGGAR